MRENSSELGNIQIMSLRSLLSILQPPRPVLLHTCLHLFYTFCCLSGAFLSPFMSFSQGFRPQCRFSPKYGSVGYVLLWEPLRNLRPVSRSPLTTIYSSSLFCYSYWAPLCYPSFCLLGQVLCSQDCPKQVTTV